MKKLIYLIFILTQLTAFAADDSEKRDRELLLSNPKDQNITAEQLNKYPEIYQFTDSVLSERSNETGMIGDAYYTREDNNRLSLSYSLSFDYEDFTKIQTADFVYLNQFDDSYQYLWWGVHAKATIAKYSAIADERTSTSGDPDSVANTTRNDEIQNFNLFGVGLGHRFKVLSEAFGTQRMFEIISVFANYVIHLDNTDKQRYTGYGLTTEYSLSRRSRSGFFYGGKLSYNWALVEKPAVTEEQKLADRSLVFGWTTFGLEIGYIF